MPLYSLLPNLGVVIHRIFGKLSSEPLSDAGLFTEIQERAYENLCRVSNVVPYTKRPNARW